MKLYEVLTEKGGCFHVEGDELLFTESCEQELLFIKNKDVVVAGFRLWNSVIDITEISQNK